MHFQPKFCKLYRETFSARIDRASSQNGFLLLHGFAGLSGSSVCGQVALRPLYSAPLGWRLCALGADCEQTHALHQHRKLGFTRSLCHLERTLLNPCLLSFIKSLLPRFYQHTGSTALCRPVLCSQTVQSQILGI
jgi:hypothetical protein